MLFKFLPREIKKYLQMSKRQRKHEIRMTLWHIPLLYVAAASLIALVTIFFDVQFRLHEYSDAFFVSFETARLLVSALLGGILTLSAFTLNSLLVVLTTFSGQFSPRMLQDFISEKQTQHLLGMFNGSFVYVLLMFLFIGNFPDHNFLLVPIITVLLALLTAIGFIFFINHSTSWMQVHNITSNMREISENIIKESISIEVEPFKVMEAGDIKKSYQHEKKLVTTEISGYIQLVSFSEMIDKAKEDDIIIEFHETIGSFILSGNPIFSYWGPGADKIDKEAYKSWVVIGHKETEIQDANSAMSKIAEVAIKSLGNSDPRSTINCIHQLTDLMKTVDEFITFTPYLVDDEKQVRVIIEPEHFESFLYRGYGMIRHYAKEDLPVITEIISSLRMLAQASDPIRHTDIWNFAENTVTNISPELIYDMDRELLLDRLSRLAKITNNENAYSILKKQLTGQTH